MGPHLGDGNDHDDDDDHDARYHTEWRRYNIFIDATSFIYIYICIGMLYLREKRKE